jgi:hypothetical protein
MKKMICIGTVLMLLSTWAIAQTTLDIEVVEVTPPVETPMETVERVLALSEAEIGVLEVSQSRRTDIIGPGVYLMMGKASQLPQLTPDELGQLPRPQHSSLLNYPATHQGRPIRLTIYVHSVREITLGRTLWLINAYDADAEGQKGITIYSLQNPFDLLPPPAQVIDGNSVFNPTTNPGGTKLELAGILVKTFNDEVAADSFDPDSPDTGYRLDFPLLVAWQLARPTQSTGGIPAILKTIIFLAILAIVALVVLFTILSKSIRRKRVEARDPAHRWHGRYTPARDTDLDDVPDDDRDDAEQIDPGLRAAAEALHSDTPPDEEETRHD